MTPCREWQGALSHGYGVRRIKGRNVRVHRWVMAQVHGEEAIKGRVVMHLCDNPRCYRYSHLVIGHQADNITDMITKGRHGMKNKTLCPQGHAYDDENTIIEKSGKRRCRTCHNEQVRQYKARRKHDRRTHTV